MPWEAAVAEAWRVSAALVGKPLWGLLTDAARSPLNQREASLIADAIARLESGEPVAYVVGRVPFHEVDVAVDRRVLIPRPETEVLVEAVIERCRTRPSPRILDVGTGSGCIALALAGLLPEAVVTASDICPHALRVAKQNLQAALGTRVRLVRGDVLTWTNGTWDVIVSNPPYVPTEEIDSLPPSVREWEPLRALDGGPGGLTYLLALVSQARPHLAPGGFLAVELAPNQAALVQERAHAMGFDQVEVVRDLSGRDRVVVARLGGTR